MNVGHVCTMGADIVVVLAQPVEAVLLYGGSPGGKAGDAVDYLDREVETVEAVRTTMSKGVVVVPSSLKPRTWMPSWLVRR